MKGIREEEERLFSKITLIVCYLLIVIEGKIVLKSTTAQASLETIETRPQPDQHLDL